MNHTDGDISLSRLQWNKSALGCGYSRGITHSKSARFLLFFRFRILIRWLFLSTSFCKECLSVKIEICLQIKTNKKQETNMIFATLIDDIRPPEKTIVILLSQLEKKYRLSFEVFLWLSAWRVIAKYEFGCNWFHFNAKYDSPLCSHKKQLTSVMWLAPSTALKVSKEEGYRNRVKRIWQV